MIAQKLYEEAKKNLGVCVGLDTDLSYIPAHIMKQDISLREKVFAFNRAIIDATRGDAACFKVQIAYYEAMGLEGLAAYADTLRYIRSLGKIAVADVKRGDIAATAKMYAKRCV